MQTAKYSFSLKLPSSRICCPASNCHSNRNLWLHTGIKSQSDHWIAEAHKSSGFDMKWMHWKLGRTVEAYDISNKSSAPSTFVPDKCQWNNTAPAEYFVHNSWDNTEMCRCKRDRLDTQVVRYHLKITQQLIQIHTFIQINSNECGQKMRLCGYADITFQMRIISRPI